MHYCMHSLLLGLCSQPHMQHQLTRHHNCLMTLLTLHVAVLIRLRNQSRSCSSMSSSNHAVAHASYIILLHEQTQRYWTLHAVLMTYAVARKDKASVGEMQAAVGMQLLEVLLIMTRSQSNRQRLLALGVLPPLATAMKVTCHLCYGKHRCQHRLVTSNVCWYPQS